MTLYDYILYTKTLTTRQNICSEKITSNQSKRPINREGTSKIAPEAVGFVVMDIESLTKLTYNE
jgi:hypothetical protein